MYTYEQTQEISIVWNQESHYHSKTRFPNVGLKYSSQMIDTQQQASISVEF